MMTPLRWTLFLIVPFVVMFTLGGLWSSVLISDFAARHAPAIVRPAAEVKLGMITVSYALTTLFMGFLFSQSFRTTAVRAMDGFRFGGLFGAIMTLPAYLLIHAAWDASLSLLLADAGWHVIEQGIGGVVMAAIFRPAAAK